MTREYFERDVLPVSRNLYRSAFRFLSNREEAEDTVQEVFIKLWNMRGKLSEYKSVEALALTMVRNQCLDILRRRKRQIFSDITPPDTRTSDMDPHSETVATETCSNVMEIVNDLPEQYRMLIHLKDVEGYEYEEIAEMTGTNVNMLRVSLSRARKMVRDTFKKKYYESSGTGKATG